MDVALDLISELIEIAASGVMVDESVLEAEKQRLQEELWNAGTLGFAFAVMGESADSTGADVEVQCYGAWLMFAAGFEQNDETGETDLVTGFAWNIGFDNLFDRVF